MSIPFTCMDLILARAVAHQASGCDLPTALDAEALVWRRHRRRKLTAQQWFDLVQAEIEALERVQVCLPDIQ